MFGFKVIWWALLFTLMLCCPKSCAWKHSESWSSIKHTQQFLYSPVCTIVTMGKLANNGVMACLHKL
jgi:hypothetical protein